MFIIYRNLSESESKKVVIVAGDQNVYKTDKTSQIEKKTAPICLVSCLFDTEYYTLELVGLLLTS